MVKARTRRGTESNSARIGSPGRRIWLALPLAILVVGCERVESPVQPGRGEIEAAVAADQSTVAGDAIARAFALALREPSARITIRNAMRDSRVSEHKLVLQDFLGTSPGHQFLQTAAERSGIAATELQRLISLMPRLDFYLPVQSQRRGWRGADKVAVGLTLEIDNPVLTAYTPKGKQLTLDSRAGEPSQTVIILHPAEYKSVLEGIGDTNGETIEDAAAEEVGGGVVMTSCSDTRTGCDGDGGGGGAMLTQMKAYINDGWGSVEMRVVHQNSSGSDIWSYEKGGMTPGTWYTVNRSTVTTGVAQIWVEETDSGVTGSDDYWGSASIAASGSITYVWGECGPVYQDGGWQSPCGYATYGDAAWHRLVRTAALKYVY